MAREQLSAKSPLVLTHIVLVNRWDYTEVTGYLTDQVERLEGRDWTQLAERIGVIFRSEFEDYQP